MGDLIGGALVALPILVGSIIGAFVAGRRSKRDPSYKVPGSAAECDQIMRSMTNGERGCSNPAEHARR
jgi:hypothetical protein